MLAVDFYSIGKLTRMFDVDTIEKKREAAKEFIDERLVAKLHDPAIEFLFEKEKKLVEKEIQDIIKEMTGQEAIPSGTRVRVKYGCKHGGQTYNAGDEGVIIKCMRFEEDTFNQGWYIYDVSIGKDKITARLFQHDFEVIKDELSEKLNIIKNDNRKVIAAKGLPDIIYDGECFRTEDGKLLGETAEKVGNNLPALKVAELSVDELDMRTLLITKNSTVESVREWFAEHYLCGTIYLKNPMAQIVVKGIKEAKDIDELTMDVYWSVNSRRENLVNVTLDSLCKELGLQKEQPNKLWTCKEISQIGSKLIANNDKNDDADDIAKNPYACGVHDGILDMMMRLDVNTDEEYIN